MIPGSAKSWQTSAWQDALKTLVTQPSALTDRMGVGEAEAQLIAKASGSFPLRIPARLLDRFSGQDKRHPVLRQFLPDARELDPVSGFSQDPLREGSHNPVPGLIHKYKDRVLLIISSSCPVHCRYCFRRHFPYADNRNGQEEWQQALDYIRANDHIREVIYSGGDPLSAPDWLLDRLTHSLSSIAHLQRLRVHTRYPLAIPQRVTPECIRWLTGTRLLSSMVLHCNHPEEIDDSVKQALLTLRHAGVTLLNQSVLLRGINDQLTTLVSLSETLYQCGVLPYYLHLLDRVAGAAHFEVPDAEARVLYRQLQAELPGYLLPRLVREEAGAPSKSPCN